MDIDKKIELIKKAPTEEVITEEDLRCLLETNEHPTAYNGFEPSGLVHLGTGLICSYKMKDFIEAGIKFKIYLACWHAFINNKLGGDMDLIKKAATHFKHSWISLGVPENKVTFVWPDEEYKDITYWEKVIKIAKQITISRGARTLEIMGRKAVEGNYVSDFMYTPMQVADIFHFKIDICQLGMDQRKANVLARELGEKLGFWKPVCVHNHLLQGLAQPEVWPLPKDPKKAKEMLVGIKMSKSKPKTCIFIYDEPEEIKQKMMDAFCPEKVTTFNPVLDIAKHIIFREYKKFKIERLKKYGGNAEYLSYLELENEYKNGKLHPLDLKKAVAECLISILEPVRHYFKSNKNAAECLQVIKSAKKTR